ncbi:unnamed protein product [Effrenium voratum]|uniref:Kinesin motor domain-containing protein n=1 Tax=Effrenium voratum TaxID=2562239 RepID=A0AA36IM42_9DINO|nr:unnamed protein product [Effrenium voratum]CAJ1432142.1 unnamed protein product [Effrenium voratum]CAJ1434279.1 unnamed protein product [Effrenium voratum]
MGKARSYCIIHPDSVSHAKFGYSRADVTIEFPGEFKTGQDGLRDFAFDRVFEPSAGQAQIYQEVARPAIKDVFERMANCLFLAVGASGGGKTFTMTGGTKRFDDRGLIPRSISAVFETLAARTDREDFRVAVSFFEIYREQVIDLLSKAYAESATRHIVRSEREAYNLLFEGDSRRHFEQLPSNSETSRGHVFFQLYITRANAEAVLAFVDVAAPSPKQSSIDTSIAQSLAALRAVARSMCAGLPADQNSTLLTRLLEQWLTHDDIVTLLPLKYQSCGESYDFLQLARILHQALKSRAGACEGHPRKSSPVAGPMPGTVGACPADTTSRDRPLSHTFTPTFAMRTPRNLDACECIGPDTEAAPAIRSLDMKIPTPARNRCRVPKAEAPSVPPGPVPAGQAARVFGVDVRHRHSLPVVRAGVAREASPFRGQARPLGMPHNLVSAHATRVAHVTVNPHVNITRPGLANASATCTYSPMRGGRSAARRCRPSVSYSPLPMQRVVARPYHSEGRSRSISPMPGSGVTSAPFPWVPIPAGVKSWAPGHG